MEDKEKNSFNYTYSAKEQEEIKNIRKKYIPREEDNLQKLKRLDAAVHSKATMWSLVLGIIGCLVMGTGMCCCMVWAGMWFIPGIFIGIAGIGMISLAYPVYSKILARERKKIAPEIIRLTDELIK